MCSCELVLSYKALATVFIVAYFFQLGISYYIATRK